MIVLDGSLSLTAKARVVPDPKSVTATQFSERQTIQCSRISTELGRMERAKHV